MGVLTILKNNGMEKISFPPHLIIACLLQAALVGPTSSHYNMVC